MLWILTVITVLIIILLIWRELYITRVYLFKKKGCPACISFEDTWTLVKSKLSWFHYSVTEYDLSDPTSVGNSYLIETVPTIRVIGPDGAWREFPKGERNVDNVYKFIIN